MHKCIFVSFILCIISIYVSAQAVPTFIVSGRVLDSISGAGLVNADIIVTGLKGKIYPGVQTDKNGYYRISGLPTGTYILIIAAEKHATEQFSLSLLHDTTLADRLIREKQYDLGEITVNSSQVKISRKFDKMTVDLNNTALTSAGTAFDVLQKMPSVILQQEGIILLQGKLATVMIDGRPLNLSGEELKTYLNSIPSNTVYKIELIRNPSAMHEAQAAAIINIITNKPMRAGWNGNISLGTSRGHYARYYPAVDFNYRNKKLNLFGSYSFTRLKEITRTESDRPVGAGNPSQFIDINTATISDNKNQNIKLGLDYTINKTSLFGIVLYANTNRQSQNMNNNTLFSKSGVQDSVINLVTHNRVSAVNPSLNIYYKLTPDTTRHSELILNLDYWRYNRQPEQQFNNSFYNNTGNKYRDDLTLRSNTPGINDIYSFKADYTHPLKKGKILSGVKIYLAKRDNNFVWENLYNNQWYIDTSVTNQFLYKENINAMYAGYEHTWKKLSFQLMLRAEQTNISGNSITIHEKFTKNYLDLFPSINLEYTLSELHQFNLSYRKSINRPPYNYLDPFRQFQNQYSYTLGNPSLLPAISGSLEAGHSFKNILFTTLSYTWTKNAFSMLYLQNPENNALTTTYDNLSFTKNWELDINCNLSITKKWSTSITSVLTYNYVNTAFRGAPVKNEGWGFNLFLFNNLTLPHNFSGSVVFAYSAPYNGTIFQYSSSGFINIGINKTFMKNRAAVNLAVSDQITHVSFKSKTNYNNLMYQQSVFRDSRVISLTFRYKLGNLKLKQSSNRKTGIESEKTRMDNK